MREEKQAKPNPKSLQAKEILVDSSDRRDPLHGKNPQFTGDCSLCLLSILSCSHLQMCEYVFSWVEEQTIHTEERTDCMAPKADLSSLFFLLSLWNPFLLDQTLKPIPISPGVRWADDKHCLKALRMPLRAQTVFVCTNQHCSSPSKRRVLWEKDTNCTQPTSTLFPFRGKEVNLYRPSRQRIEQYEN